MPVTIPPKEARTITLWIRWKGAGGMMTRDVGLVVDDQGFRNVSFRVIGSVTAAKQVQTAMSD